MTKREYRAFFACMLLAAPLCCTAMAVSASSCSETTNIKSLFLIDTVDVQKPGEYQFDVVVRRVVGDSELSEYGLEGEYGAGNGWEVSGEAEHERVDHGETETGFISSAGWRLLCREGLPQLKFKAAYRHNDSSGTSGGLLAGQRVAFGSWQAAVMRNAAIHTTRYSAALTFNRSLGPFALEALAEDTPDGWERWAAASLFIISSERFDLGLAYARGGGINDGERALMIRLSTEF